MSSAPKDLGADMISRIYAHTSDFSRDLPIRHAGRCPSSVVSALFAQLSGPGRDDGRAGTQPGSAIARWVLRYAPILSQRIRCEMRRPNRSWRVDETYVRVAGRWSSLSVGVDQMQRNFEPMRRQVESWRAQLLSTAEAKLTIYRAFIEGDPIIMYTISGK